MKHMTDIKETRKKENEAIAFHYKSILDIIKTKCRRCNANSCMGCVFSHSEMLCHLKECLRLMSIQDGEACMKIFNMDYKDWRSFIEND